MPKRIILGIVVLSGVILLTYRYLGGGRELEYQETAIDEIQLTGYFYAGRPTHPGIEKLFKRVRDVSTFEPDSRLGIITYDVEETSDSIRQFLGTRNQAFQGTDSSEVRVIPAGLYIRVILDMNPIVRPTPEKVRKGAREFAHGKGLSIATWSLEIFRDEKVLEVYFPVED